MYNIIDLFGRQENIETRKGDIIQTFAISSVGGISEIRAFLNSKSFIYCWHDSVSKKIYIGSSSSCWKRFNNYKNFLIFGVTKRVNVKMINHVGAHGFEGLKFYILEFLDCGKEEIRKIEQGYLDKYEPFGKVGFNIRRQTMNTKEAFYPEESRKRISEAHSGENSSAAKLKDFQILEIKTLLAQGVELKELSVKYGVSTTVISNIKRGLTWDHIKASEEVENKLLELANFHKRKNISREDILEIRRRLKNGEKMKVLALEYNLAYTTIFSIKKFHIYAYVTE